MDLWVLLVQGVQRVHLILVVLANRVVLEVQPVLKGPVLLRHHLVLMAQWGLGDLQVQFLLGCQLYQVVQQVQQNPGPEHRCFR